MVRHVSVDNTPSIEKPRFVPIVNLVVMKRFADSAEQLLGLVHYVPLGCEIPATHAALIVRTPTWTMSTGVFHGL